MNKRKYLTIACTLFLSVFLPGKYTAQIALADDSISFDYANPKEFDIGGITVSGTDYLDKNTLILISGIGIGDKVQVPGDRFSKAIESLWKQGLFEDVKITATKIQGKNIFLDIHVVERPRLSKFSFKGIKKSEADDIRDKIKLIKGKVVTDYLLASAVNTIKEHFVDKGFQNTAVEIKQEKDTTAGLKNSVILTIIIKKGDKVKIQDIFVKGNHSVSVRKIYRTMKDTKRKRWFNLFNPSKFLEENYEKDKQKIVEKYNQKGYRDARIVKDSVYKVDLNRVAINITIDEGKKYFFRNISWVGNTKYSSKELNAVLGIKKGDVFDQALLDMRLSMNPNGADVTSLYMDDGYLFFQVTPVEVLVENDSIDFEMRIYEGKQAIINKVTVTGNLKTNDKVIMREIRTRPGQLFRRSDIIRSQRELAQLGFFNPEKMNINPVPNPVTGTVDIEYEVEEKPSDQAQLSGGWGGGRVVLTASLIFNNFSTKNFFKEGSWRPLPSGDGQKLSISAQTNGKYFQSYNISFTEPWLGGRKPNSLTTTLYHSIQNPTGLPKSDAKQSLFTVSGVSLGLGKRLKWPDDYFSVFHEPNYKYYTLKNYSLFKDFQNGYANNFNYRFVVSRNSIDKPIFETRGSQITFTALLSPPYSLFNNVNYQELSAADKYKFLEYQKYKFTAAWFTSLTNKKASEGKETRNLVLYTKFGFGLLAPYNKQRGLSPFERFYMGGNGLTGYNIDGREVIALRGYEDNALNPVDGQGNALGTTAIAKYTMELRYPLTLNPQATIYTLAFAEAGNTWLTGKQLNPFDVKRSAGVGIRIFMPFFGLLGFDYGWGFDKAPGQQYIPGKPHGKFNFIIGYTLGEL